MVQNERDTHTRKFTDRELFINAFYNALNNPDENHKILVYYGVGGIGKTSSKRTWKANRKKRKRSSLVIN
jgi:hypothetical protein